MPGEEPEINISDISEIWPEINYQAISYLVPVGFITLHYQWYYSEEYTIPLCGFLKSAWREFLIIRLCCNFNLISRKIFPCKLQLYNTWGRTNKSLEVREKELSLMKGARHVLNMKL